MLPFASNQLLTLLVHGQCAPLHWVPRAPPREFRLYSPAAPRTLPPTRVPGLRRADWRGGDTRSQHCNSTKHSETEPASGEHANDFDPEDLSKPAIVPQVRGSDGRPTGQATAAAEPSLGCHSLTDYASPRCASSLMSLSASSWAVSTPPSRRTSALSGGS